MRQVVLDPAVAAECYAAASAALLFSGESAAFPSDCDYAAVTAFRAARVALVLALAQEAYELWEPDEMFSLLHVASAMNTNVDTDPVPLERPLDWPFPPDGPIERRLSEQIVALAGIVLADEDFEITASRACKDDWADLIAREARKLAA